MESSSDNVPHQNAVSVGLDGFVGEISTPQSCYSSEWAAAQGSFSQRTY